MNALTKIIEVVNEAYDGTVHRGDNLIQRAHAGENLSDGLAKFIVVELLETNDPTASDFDQYRTAYQAMYTAREELNRVVEKLDELYGEAV